jgi:hypothetical protein
MGGGGRTPEGRTSQQRCEGQQAEETGQEEEIRKREEVCRPGCACVAPRAEDVDVLHALLEVIQQMKDPYLLCFWRRLGSSFTKPTSSISWIFDLRLSAKNSHAPQGPLQSAGRLVHGPHQHHLVHAEPQPLPVPATPAPGVTLTSRRYQVYTRCNFGEENLMVQVAGCRIARNASPVPPLYTHSRTAQGCGRFAPGPGGGGGGGFSLTPPIPTPHWYPLARACTQASLPRDSCFYTRFIYSCSVCACSSTGCE